MPQKPNHPGWFGPQAGHFNPIICMSFLLFHNSIKAKVPKSILSAGLCRYNQLLQQKTATGKSAATGLLGIHMSEAQTEREIMEYDVIIVGAGPAGLSCAIRLKQLKQDLMVAVIEKSAEIGAHILSGAVIEPGALDELLPSWRDNPPPICIPVKDDQLSFLTRASRYKMPTPPQQNNHGNLIVSLGALCAWLEPQAEAAGVDIFPGYAASGVRYTNDGSVLSLIHI